MTALQNQLEELERKCKQDFECKIADLPEFNKRLREEAETALLNAEVILGIREGTVQVVKEAPAIAPKKTIVHKPSEDADSL